MRSDGYKIPKDIENIIVGFFWREFHSMEKAYELITELEKKACYAYTPIDRKEKPKWGWDDVRELAEKLATDDGKQEDKSVEPQKVDMPLELKLERFEERLKRVELNLLKKDWKV